MEMIRGGNRHRFDIAQGNVIELGGPSRGELLSKRPGARFVAIANQLDLPARVGCKRERVIPAPNARSDDSDPYLLSHSPAPSNEAMLSS